MKCPSCGSPQITRRHPGQDAGTKIGALLGASIAAANAMRSARVGILLGSCLGPVGSAAGGITGAVISGICTGSAASAICGAIGNVADREFLDDGECEACGHTFRRADARAATTNSPQGCGRPGFFGSTVSATADGNGGDDGARN